MHERGIAANHYLPPPNRSTSQHHFAAFSVRLARGGEAGSEVTVGGGGGAEGVISSGIGGIGRGAECLGALRLDKLADRGALEHERLLCGDGVGGVRHGLRE